MRNHFSFGKMINPSPRMHSGGQERAGIIAEGRAERSVPDGTTPNSPTHSKPRSADPWAGRLDFHAVRHSRWNLTGRGVSSEHPTTRSQPQAASQMRRRRMVGFFRRKEPPHPPPNPTRPVSFLFTRALPVGKLRACGDMFRAYRAVASAMRPSLIVSRFAGGGFRSAIRRSPLPVRDRS